MALQRQNVTIPLGVGIDTKTDQKQVAIGKLTAIENAVFTSPKSLRKRFGKNSLTTAIQGGGNITSGKLVATFGSELLVADGSNLYAYSPTLQKWINRGALYGAGITTSPVSVDSVDKQLPNCAYGNGYVVYAWETTNDVDDGISGFLSTGVYACVIDSSNGRAVVPATLIDASGSVPKCSFANNTFYVHYVSGTEIHCQTVSATAPASFGGTVVVATDPGLAANPVYDVAPSGTSLVLTYKTTTPSIKTGLLQSNGQFSGTPKNFVVNPGTALAVVSDGTANIYVLYDNSPITNEVGVLIYNITLSNTPSPVYIASSFGSLGNIGAVCSSPGVVWVYFSQGGGSILESAIFSASVTSTGSVSATFTFASVMAQFSKPFMVNGVVHQLAVYSDTLQGCYYLLSGTTSAVCVNTLGYQNSTEIGTPFSRLSNVAALSASQFVVPVLLKNQLRSENGHLVGLGGVNAALIDFGASSLWQSQESGGLTFIAAGMLSHYDGSSVVEAGFHYYPALGATSVGGTGPIVAGTRQYVACYEWTDSMGQIHRSAPSVPVTVTNSGSGSGTVNVFALRLTQKQNVLVTVYRTINAGTTFYKAGSISNTAAAAGTAFTDAVSDADLVKNEILYTTGGIVDNIPPPGCSSLVDYRSRVVITSSEDQNQSWYSKTFNKGTGLAFNDSFYLRVDQGKLGLKASGVLDDKLVYFKQNQIYITAGQGPLDTAINNDFQSPANDATDVGCSDPKSVVRTPLGLIFKSSKGYYLLDRSLQVSYKGVAVEAYNGLSVTSGVLLEDVNQVRFTHSDGSLLIYDYFMDEWGTFTGYLAVSAANWNGTYVMLTSAGVVKQESASGYLDDGAAVQTHVTLPWIQLRSTNAGIDNGAIEGFQRIYEAVFLGDKLSNHTLTIKVGYDFDPAWAETFTFDMSTVSGALEELKIRPARQKCNAIRFDISDSNPSNIDGGGVSLSALTLVVGLKAGTNKIPASRVMVGS